MLFWISLTRLTAALTFLNMCFTQNSDVQQKERRPSKYPLTVYNMYKEQVLKKTPKTLGEWSAWSGWTPCSRSCGGGVTQQTRNCITTPADSRFIKKQRRRRQSIRHAARGCVGLYKRIRLCNNQACQSEQDFRHEQCAAFNNRLFRGTRHQWEPFLKVKDECALNCRAVGMNFFATLNKTVIDGTPCIYPMTHTGKAAPRGSRGVCIEGYCKVVNSRGVIGTLDDDQEQCSACLKGSCRSINGIFTRPDIPPGYSLVAQIPAGACRILVQQLKETRNFLALKNTNGSYIVNGDWKFSNSRVFQGAGTKFVYVRQDENSLETISSPGPLANAVDIMIVNYQLNAGIKYGYSLPVSDAPAIAPPLIKRTSIEPSGVETRRLEIPLNNTLQRDEGRSIVTPNTHRRTRVRRKHFQWKVTGLTACSKSCGGGIQTYVRTCMREVSPHNLIPVHDRRCSHLDSASLTPVRCNTDPCPPDWEFSWSECSVSCGEGIQHFVPHCKQDQITGQISVSESLCPRPKPALLSRPCQGTSCDNPNDNELNQVIGERIDEEWTTGSWSQCSVSCGTGHRTRSVTCPSGHCRVETRPSHAEYCHMDSCITPATSSPLSHTSSSFSSWLMTEWSQCSETCGTGRQTRLAVCGIQDQNRCSAENKPELSRACSSDKDCGGRWFVGPWGLCSDSCSGRARQKRDVFCVIKIRGQPHITNEMTCTSHLKPPEEQACEGVCPLQWYSGDWGSCEGLCPVGVQRRQVTCLDIQGKPANGCPDDKMPTAKRTCACQSKVENNREKYQPAQDEPVDRTCVDRIRKCKVAVQARLCNYSYYTTHCCESCRRAQDLLE